MVALCVKGRRQTEVNSAISSRAASGPLQQPREGPYKIPGRCTHAFRLNVEGKSKMVSLNFFYRVDTGNFFGSAGGGVILEIRFTFLITPTTETACGVLVGDADHRRKHASGHEFDEEAGFCPVEGNHLIRKVDPKFSFPPIRSVRFRRHHAFN